jgi:hypothetical protein
MTDSALNPFPDYAVTRLAAGQQARALTIVTPAIAMGRKLVDQYAAGVAMPVKAGQTNAALCAVRGDYGTGKTHLLNDVAAQIEAVAGPSHPSIVRVTCIETDPLSWFRTKVGPQLDALPLYDTAVQLYGNAGKAVARSTRLTAAAEDELAEDPARIVNLVRKDRLSIDEVGREFESELAVICKDYDQVVRRVLSRLVWSETEGAARKWLSGATLLAREAELLGVPTSIESADQASSVVGAIAAMHKAAARPFVVLADELEHFTRYDEARNSWGNVTWLKRLLEQLGNAGALALVAGHWSAWKTTKDYLDRFPQYAPIDLVKLEASKVREVVTTLLGRVPPGFGDMQANVIASVTDGNMRRVMSLCNLLFRQTSGFTTALTERQIRDAWSSVAQRIPQEQALEEIADMLEPRGFRSRHDHELQGIPFDLVAEGNDGRVILVEAKHSSTTSDHYDAARKFIDKLGAVVSPARQEVGVFLANGSIDDELLGILRGSGIPGLRWFDLTSRDVMEKITAEIDVITGQASDGARTGAQPSRTRSVAPLPAAVTSAVAIEVESAKLKAMNADLERKLHDLDARRQVETQALKERLETLAKERSSPRDDSIRGSLEVSAERARASYEAMLEEPSLNKKLRYLGTPLLMGMFYVVIGLAMLLARQPIAFSFLTWMPRATGELVIVLYAIGSVLMGVWFIWQRYSRVADYFEFARQTIRDLYLREVPIDVLGRVNTVLRRTIDRRQPRRAKDAAIDQLLGEKLPDLVRDYLRDARDVPPEMYGTPK